MDIADRSIPRPDSPSAGPTPEHAEHAAAPSASDAECPLCGAPLVGLHCKLVCHRCGYREDCSDLFPVRRNKP